MDQKSIIGTIIISILLMIFIYDIFVSNPKTTFEEKRDEILLEIFSTIEKAEELSGIYECCIEPPCTMCFLGNWIWDDGTCDCDTMMMNGEWDKVCPQCIRGMEEGRCKSTKTDTQCSNPGDEKQ